MRPHLVATFLLGLALALAACDDEREGSFTSEAGTGTETTGTTGTTGTTPEKAPTGKASKTFTIGETEFKLEPASFELEEAGVVEFVVKNDGEIVHALEVEGPTGEVETEEIQPGKTARLKADVSKAGEYELYCPIGNHKEQGMTGELVVEGGGAGPDREDDSNGSGGRSYSY
jgi:uncharacterized cupredoxin-like copper-binding protein